jgi:hypothetical protein
VAKAGFRLEFGCFMGPCFWLKKCGIAISITRTPIRKQIIKFLDEDGFVLTDDCGSYLIKQNI